MKKRCALIVILLIVAIGFSGCKNKSEELMEAGMEHLEKEDYDNAIELFEAAVEEDRNKETILTLNMAKEYIDIFNYYSNFLEVKENRYEEINLLELGDNYDLYIAKEQMDNFNEKYKDYFRTNLAKDLSMNINKDLEEEIELSIVVFEYQVAMNPDNIDYIEWYLIVKENFNDQYLTDKQIKYVDETIYNRLVSGDYYPVNYVEEQGEKLVKLFPNDGPLTKTLAYISSGEYEADLNGEEIEEVSTPSTIENVDEEEVILREPFDPNNVPVEYCTDFDRYLAVEMASDFFNTDDIEIIGVYMTPEENPAVLLLLNREMLVKVYMDGMITEVID